MTKTKLVSKTGEVVRVDLHPTTKEIRNGHTYAGRLRLWIKQRGFTLARRK